MVDLAASRPGKRLDIDLAMVSHIDDDHINGLLDFAEEIEKGSAPATIKRLWHNSLEHLLDEEFETASLQQATASLGAPRAGEERGWYGKVLASVPQGQQLHGYAVRLGLVDTMNHPFQPLVAVKPNQRPAKLQGLSLRVLAPSMAAIEALRKEWKKKRDERITVAYSDPSPYNLSSIVVLAEYGGKRMLLTGDARGDYIIAGLKAAGLLSDGHFHVDLLKLPHHGSQNNATAEFFAQITADHYVVSGDGVKFPNPHKKAMQWLDEARSGEDFKVYCTYALPHMKSLFGKKLVVPSGTASSVLAAL